MQRKELWWISEDRQGEMDMTGSSSPEEALAWLLEQCGSEEDRQGILAGSFMERGWVEGDDDDMGHWEEIGHWEAERIHPVKSAITTIINYR